jgi:hypothetical protein
MNGFLPAKATAMARRPVRRMKDKLSAGLKE